MKQKIFDVFKNWTDQGPGGQVLVRKDGEIIFSECFGYADIERKIKVTPQSIFHLASVSKQITCVCIFILVEKGLIDINKDIREYIPELVNFKEPITVKEMMNNISGIRDQWELQMFGGVRLGDIIKQSDLLAINARQKEINFPPGSKYLYSNTNFTYLAEIILRVSGKTLPQFAKENVFEPLNMTDTFIREEYDSLVENRALSYVSCGDGNFKWKPLNFSNYGATSLHSRTEDFLKWMNTFVNPTVIKQETLQEMLTVPALANNEKTTYACGLMVSTHKGKKTIGHSGADAGYRSQMYHFPEDKLDIIIFSNTENMILDSAALKIADIVLGLETTSEEKTFDCFTDEVINPIPGDYCLTELGSVLSISNANLITWGDKKISLIHEKGNKYKLDSLFNSIYFTKDSVFIQGGKTLYKLVQLLPHEFSKEELSAIAGTYFSEEVEAFYKINAKNSTAEMSHKRYGNAPISKIDENTYFAPLEKSIKFQINKAPDSTIESLSFIGTRVLNIKFNKI